MKIILFVVFLNFFNANHLLSNYSSDFNLEMFLMRKGTNVKIIILSNGINLPSKIEIERKSTAPLSKFRKILTVSKEQLILFKKHKKLLLTDHYPESRQLNSYYRIRFVSKKGLIKTLPNIFLAKASNKNSITFGDHKQDETMFETEEEKKIITYEEYSTIFSVKIIGINILITISGGKSLEGSWFIERKYSKPLASYRRIKAISNEYKELTINGEHVFIDRYPESKKLDAYYRLMVILKNGKILEFPSVLLEKTANGSK